MDHAALTGPGVGCSLPGHVRGQSQRGDQVHLQLLAGAGQVHRCAGVRLKQRGVVHQAVQRTVALGDAGQHLLGFIGLAEVGSHQFNLCARGLQFGLQGAGGRFRALVMAPHAPARSRKLANDRCAQAVSASGDQNLFHG